VKKDDPNVLLDYPHAAPVPFLTAAQAIETFHLPTGLRAEVVAEEPMVQQPVAMAFDPDGRIWVVEMRSYMPNPQGIGEDRPLGRVSILKDTDGDGRMDTSCVFIDGLVMPRAIGLARGGALIAAPPNLYFCKDTDGDGKADLKIVIDHNYGDGVQPEHQANGLMYGLDNWVYNADFGKRYRDAGSNRWIPDPVHDMGQWGITQDDIGRLFFNNNSDQLRADLIAPHYATRNPHLGGGGDAINVQLAASQDVWPAHPTAVNRGYRQNFLRDGRLRQFTAACGPLIYRGDALPVDYYGNAFVCEPSANVVRRNIIRASASTGALAATNPYDRTEFIASTYERFRPVNLYNGPDGALYIVDMHHGLLQHKAFLTPYARQQYLNRRLDQYLMTGRIYRIVADGFRRPPPPELSTAKTIELVTCLSDANGWRRQTAQRLLVERNESFASAPLKRLAAAGENPLGRLHALWTLDGMHRLDPPTLRLALVDRDPRLRAAAIRLSEPLLESRRRAEILDEVLALAADRAPGVRLQFACTISEVGTPQAYDALARVLGDQGSDGAARDAAISGLRGRELEFLQRLLRDPDWSSAPSASDGRADVLAALARCIFIEANPRRVDALLDLVATQAPEQSWRQAAMLDGVAALNKGKTARKPLVLTTAPRAAEALATMNRPALRAKASAVTSMIVWPGKSGYVPPPPPPPLTPQQQARFDRGAQIYATLCTQCHKPDGMGQPGLAPPLVNSEWVLGPQARVVRIVLNGLRGAVTVNGSTFNYDMPSLAALDDEKIASALTFVRRSWDHGASPVEVQTVTRIRAECRDRMEAWTERELLRVR
jgi:mono/diheme cytochrome c family protein/glucose/arabinose dehydrogenase